MVQCSSGLVALCFQGLAPLVRVDACEDEEDEVQDPVRKYRISIGVAKNTHGRKSMVRYLPDEAGKDYSTQFESANVFEHSPQIWPACFFHTATPELEQTQTG